jgi:hypothetical protein
VDNKIIGLIVIVLIVIIGAVYLLANPSNQNQTAINTSNITSTGNNTIQSNATNTSDNGNSSKNNNQTNGTGNIKISSQQAQKIAVDSTKELSGQTVTAGTPTLFKWTANNRHTWVWKVPLFDTNGKSAGSMDVDAYTGEVIMNE